MMAKKVLAKDIEIIEEASDEESMVELLTASITSERLLGKIVVADD
jgi:hypothetical protein